MKKYIYQFMNNKTGELIGKRFKTIKEAIKNKKNNTTLIRSSYAPHLERYVFFSGGL